MEIGSLGIVTEILVKGLKYYINENGQNTEKRPEETCCDSNYRGRPSANADVKNSQEVNYSINTSGNAPTINKPTYLGGCPREWSSNSLALWSLLDHSRGGPRGVMVKAMDCGIVVREFVLQSRYYVHFRSNTIRKSLNPLILPAMG